MDYIAPGPLLLEWPPDQVKEADTPKYFLLADFQHPM